MTEKRFDVLEECIRALESGADIQTLLADHPQVAAELEPILRTVIQAQSLGLPSVPAQAVNRGRAQVIKRAAEMREAAVAGQNRTNPLWRYAVAFMIVVFFLMGGNGLLRASAESLPGEPLYSLKRTWEDVRLLAARSPANRDSLEADFDRERLQEVAALLAQGRTESVAFHGILNSREGDSWLVSDIPVRVTPLTQLPEEPVLLGSRLVVVGFSGPDGFVEAQFIGFAGEGQGLIQPGPDLGTGEPPLETGNENGNGNENEDLDGDAEGNENSNEAPKNDNEGGRANDNENDNDNDNANDNGDDDSPDDDDGDEPDDD